jgi:hypothetical protein
LKIKLSSFLFNKPKSSYFINWHINAIIKCWKGYQVISLLMLW